MSVPAKFKEAMMNPAMYPRGWSHRAFHQGPRRQGQGDAARGAGVVTRVDGAVAGGAAINMEARQDNV